MRENVRKEVERFLEKEYGEDEGKDFSVAANAIVDYVLEQITIALNEEV